MASFRINRVYTRSGDSGETGLVGGARISKAHPRVGAYGTVDELNSVLGIVKERLPEQESGSKLVELHGVIERIQQELFDLGSELATPPSCEYPKMWRAKAEHATRLEQLCDHYGETLPELESFILPGGSEVAAFLHLARTVSRRAEREVVSLSLSTDPEDAVNPEVLKYINRLSDLLFILARYCLAAERKTAPLWVKESER